MQFSVIHLKSSSFTVSEDFKLRIVTSHYHIGTEIKHLALSPCDQLISYAPGSNTLKIKLQSMSLGGIQKQFLPNLIVQLGQI